MPTDLISLAARMTTRLRTGVADDIQALARRVALTSAATLVASVGLMAAIGCALTALWLVAIPWVGPIGALLIVAGLNAVLAVAAIALARQQRAPARPAIEPAHPVDPAILDPAILELSRLMTSQSARLVAAALMAGFTAGYRRH